jgi:hypothetical protein
MLTVIRLGLPDQLRRSLGCTNAIEILIAVLRQFAATWRDARMALRWTATAMLEAEKSFRQLRCGSSSQWTQFSGCPWRLAAEWGYRHSGRVLGRYWNVTGLSSDIKIRR